MIENVLVFDQCLVILVRFTVQLATQPRGNGDLIDPARVVQRL